MNFDKYATLRGTFYNLSQTEANITKQVSICSLFELVYSFSVFKQVIAFEACLSHLFNLNLRKQCKIRGREKTLKNSSSTLFKSSMFTSKILFYKKSLCKSVSYYIFGKFITCKTYQ